VVDVEELTRRGGPGETKAFRAGTGDLQSETSGGLDRENGQFLQPEIGQRDRQPITDKIEAGLAHWDRRGQWIVVAVGQLRHPDPHRRGPFEPRGLGQAEFGEASRDVVVERIVSLLVREGPQTAVEPPPQLPQLRIPRPIDRHEKNLDAWWRP